jgi:hypothetical protein
VSDDEIRIDRTPRTVRWTTEHEASFAIGHDRCKACKVRTPAPSDEVLLKLTERYPLGRRTVWPFYDETSWWPPGWTTIESRSTALTKFDVLCPDCTAKIAALLDDILRKATP